ncbi:MAG: two-component sensor histidine kinase [Novosphingobium sp.]|jgi:signal transduction histidine kinase|nr:two-component sensor histidine kinase [Novosphingobium sp.]MBP6554703.1 two-component sensor histidine kinase [Novosphingobium sp.]
MIARIRGLLWPRSLQGQLLLAVAMALLLAQTISAVLLYRAQNDRREAALIHTATIRLFAAVREEGVMELPERRLPERRDRGERAERQLKVEHSDTAPIAPGEARNPGAEAELREIMAGQGLQLGQVMVVQRPISDDPRLLKRLQRRAQMLGGQGRGSPPHLLVAAIELPQAKRWLTVRVPAPRPDPALLFTLIGQTLLLYALLFGAIALIVGRITRPLAALTGRVERFAERRDTAGQLEPKGPQDMQRLILAHNAMENSIAALLDEKDVMLGAIGHDLKTPLAALRVRIESVEDETERAKMAATIEDITRSLDDILSLARVGRPTDPLELTELNALVGQVAEEFEDMGEPVSFAPAERTVVRLRETWLRRAVRNLVVNALRYGKVARIAIVRDQAQVLIRIEDDGPGIAADQIEPMMQPFTRAEPSRNSATGGAGLGLTLARAIAEQHGGTLALANRLGADGKVTGLTATLTLPLT